jgi:choline dehydrogenase-like flavoprotein
MIEDARYLPAETAINVDICIIGAGAAGVTLAHSLGGTKSSICILESGGLSYEHLPQRLSRGTSVGVPYEALDLCRVRQFGGSTGRAGWGGWCKPLDLQDFEVRSSVPLSGWPIKRVDLDPYYAAAADLLGIKNMGATTSSGRGFPAMEQLFTEQCHLSPRTNIGESLLPGLRNNPNLRIIFHATALPLKTNSLGNHVHSIEVASTRTKRFQVRANLFVLAGGGIENARLLLLSNDESEAGLGNQHDQVGRYFMEHPRVTWGGLNPNPADRSLALYDPALPSRKRDLDASPVLNSCFEGFGLAVRPEARARMHLLDSRTWIKPSVDFKRAQGEEALQYTTFWLRKGRLHRDLLRSGSQVLMHPLGAIAASLARLTGSWRSPRCYRFVTILEQEPNPLSRITLDFKRDAFGLRCAKLDWHISPLVRHTLERVQAMIVEEMTKLGHSCWTYPQEAQMSIEPACNWVRHHMGTTRMSDEPQRGVVDSACKVHGVHNLFAAGSSVFPTGGNDMPTLTIIALALRLGQHLRSLLGRHELSEHRYPVPRTAERARNGDGVTAV